MERLLAYLDECRAEVNRSLAEALPKADLPPSTLHEAMRYSALGAGKRLRPAIAFMCGEIFRPGHAEIKHAACALEMAHCYSLIHDDLPAMDNDDLRRGRLTCHKAYNEATAILAGDALLTLAFETVAKHYQPSLAVSIISTMGHALGHSGMIGGQMMDLEGEHAVLAPEAVEDMYARKTGMLIAAACRVGAVINGGEGLQLEQVEKYGRLIGLLFQLTDDKLDATATSEQLGKTPGKDAAAGKCTLMRAYAALLQPGRDAKDKGAETAPTAAEMVEKRAQEIATAAKTELRSFGAEALMPRLLVDYILARKK